MAAWISDPWGWGMGQHFADVAHEADRPSHSPLLGPDGKPLQYARLTLGFDLSPKRKPQETP